MLSFERCWRTARRSLKLTVTYIRSICASSRRYNVEKVSKKFCEKLLQIANSGIWRRNLVTHFFKKFTDVYSWYPNVSFRVRGSSPVDTTMSLMNPVLNLKPKFLNTHFNIILLFMPKSPKWVFHTSFSTNILYEFLVYMHSDFGNHLWFEWWSWKFFGQYLIHSHICEIHIIYIESFIRISYCYFRTSDLDNT